MKKEKNIINFLNKYWFKRNVWFGDVIHKLKPNNITEWVKFLKSKNWYFIKNLDDYGFKRYEHSYWIWYIKNSFWKLYASESIAIVYFKNKYGIDLKFADRSLDLKYGIDFVFNNNNFLIVKSCLYENDLKKFLDYKKLNNFKFKKFNNQNSKIYLFVSGNKRLFLYDQTANKFKESNIIFNNLE